MIDFTACEVNKFKAYGGANGNKIHIRYQGKGYMLKFPPVPGRSKTMSYTNGCISEYLACHIYGMLGMKVQETILGIYTNRRGKEKAEAGNAGRNAGVAGTRTVHCHGRGLNGKALKAVGGKGE